MCEVSSCSDTTRRVKKTEKNAEKLKKQLDVVRYRSEGKKQEILAAAELERSSDIFREKYQFSRAADRAPTSIPHSICRNSELNCKVFVPRMFYLTLSSDVWRHFSKYFVHARMDCFYENIP